MTKLETFLESNKSDLLTDLKDKHKSFSHDAEISPEDYTEPGCDEPSMDIRLCIDADKYTDFNWIIRIGSSDFDPIHSRYCAANLLTIDSNIEETLNELINDILEQVGS